MITTDLNIKELKALLKEHNCSVPAGSKKQD